MQEHEISFQALEELPETVQLLHQRVRRREAELEAAVLSTQPLPDSGLVQRELRKLKKEMLAAWRGPDSRAGSDIELFRLQVQMALEKIGR